MPKTIFITGATDGIGRATAQRLAAKGHDLLIHGRNEKKLNAVAAELAGASQVDAFCADLSNLDAVATLAAEVRAARSNIDLLINNAGVFRIDDPITAAGEDVRFVVNTFAPALLTRLLLPVIPANGRIVHLSSAAQASVDLQAMAGEKRLEAMEAYAQSKLALTMWSAAFAHERGQEGPISVAVNPGSLLATNMVREGFGVAGNDIDIGAGILERAAMSDEFAEAQGLYFDNDAGRFAAPHADVADLGKTMSVAAGIEKRIADYL